MKSRQVNLYVFFPEIWENCDYVRVVRRIRERDHAQRERTQVKRSAS